MPVECLSLARSPHLTFLKSLDLSCNPIKLQGLQHLFDHRQSKLSHLKRLELYYCSINGSQYLEDMTNEQKGELVYYSGLQVPHLEYLNISYNKIGAELMQVLMGETFGMLSPTL